MAEESQTHLLQYSGLWADKIDIPLDYIPEHDEHSILVDGKLYNNSFPDTQTVNLVLDCQETAEKKHQS